MKKFWNKEKYNLISKIWPDVLVSTDWNDFREQLVNEAHGQVHSHHSHNAVMSTVQWGRPKEITFHIQNYRE